jgi:hypothetical protein
MSIITSPTTCSVNIKSKKKLCDCKERRKTNAKYKDNSKKQSMMASAKINDALEASIEMRKNC